MLQLTIVIPLFLFLSVVLFRFLREFPLLTQLSIPLYAALFLFFAGFALRLSGTRQAIDIGYLCTEASTLFVTIIFTATLLLGQQKYWKLD